jgi:hypothetical protein
MLVILAVALVVIAALVVLGIAVHVLFSPWLLVAAIAVLVWMKFRPRSSRR